MCYLLATYVRSWRTVDNFNKVHATSLPSSTVDRSTGEDNIILNKILCILTVTVVSYVFIMRGHCSPVVCYNYHGT